MWNGLGRTFLWMFFTVFVKTVLGVLLGFLFWGSTRLPGRRIALTMIFTPMILAPASTGTFFRLIYDPTFGVANYLLTQVVGQRNRLPGGPGLGLAPWSSWLTSGCGLLSCS